MIDTHEFGDASWMWFVPSYVAVAVGCGWLPTSVAVAVGWVSYSRVWRDGRWTWLVSTCMAVAVGRTWFPCVWRC